MESQLLENRRECARHFESHGALQLLRRDLNSHYIAMEADAELAEA
jgi:hypothetical protein